MQCLDNCHSASVLGGETQPCCFRVLWLISVKQRQQPLTFPGVVLLEGPHMNSFQSLRGILLLLPPSALAADDSTTQGNMSRELNASEGL